MFTVRLGSLYDPRLEELKGGFRYRSFKLNPQLNVGGAFATRGGRARTSQDNTSTSINVIV